MGVLANAGENIEHFAPVRFGVLHAVGREDRQSIRVGQIDQCAVNPFFAPNEMPLNFNENIFATEGVDQKCARSAAFWVAHAPRVLAMASAPSRTFLDVRDSP